MNRKTKISIIALILVAAVCIAGVSGFLIGKHMEHVQAAAAQMRLQTLNRSSIEKLKDTQDTIYVIGHRSPDTDTVSSAIAYARLLNLLGISAQAAITEPVNAETAYILQEAGVETPDILKDAAGKSIFLVDHSEYVQAAEGMTDATIVGVLDHHGIGSVTTGQQVFYEARPIGAASTIVWLDYLNYGVEIDRSTAFLILGALLSDTDNLTGSTVTEADRQAAVELAGIAGVSDVDALYKALHTEKLSYKGMSDADILFSDYKEYEIAGVKVGIGLASAIDEESAAALAERMKEVIPECFAQKNVDVMYMSVGMREDGKKIDRDIAADERSAEILKAAFPDYDEFDGTSYIFRTGIGRKTIFVPGLTDYLNAHPGE